MKMLTSTRELRSILALGAVALLAAAPARADLKIAMHTNMNSPAMQNMPAQMSNLLQSTLYISGKKVSVATPVLTIIFDQDSKKMTMINNMARSYTTSPYDPSTTGLLMQGGLGGGIAGMPGGQVQVVDTGRTTTFLGHKVRHYVLTAHMNINNMGEMSSHEDVLAAQDFSPAEMASYNALSAGLPGKTHIKGIPLKIVVTSTGGPMGSMTMTEVATSISTQKVSASEFSVPSGYTQSQGGMPGMAGAGMGAPTQ